MTDVVERMAYVLENRAEDEWERVAGALVRLAPIAADDRAAFLALQKRTRRLEDGQPLAFALAALAVGTLMQGVQDGRLDAPALGETLARLWATPLVKGPRYAKSLAAAAQAHAAMPAVVFSLLCAMVEVPQSAGRKDLAPLLELLLECSVARAGASRQHHRRPGHDAARRQRQGRAAKLLEK